jgi:V/A-type H+-transporting ATPase subunit B
MDSITRRYSTVTAVSGPLVFARIAAGVAIGDICAIRLASGEKRRGLVLEISRDSVVVQALGGTHGMDTAGTSIEPLAERAEIGLSPDVLGRVMDGYGSPIDGLLPIIPDKFCDINGLPMNPAGRERPDEFIETGISAIDGLNTLVRGQKLPIFSCAGLAASELALQIVRQASVSDGKEFSIVFGAVGITNAEAFFFMEGLEKAVGAMRTVAYLNLASDPVIERLFTPRLALTTAEYLAFDLGMEVLVVLTDMTAYCDALRVVGSAREEIPGRRSYPGYMYTDLASIYERAGRLKGRPGSVTIVPILTMPEDDITHPIPDLTGYITEGQIVLDRALSSKGIYPPVAALSSLSRLMGRVVGGGKGEGGGRTRAGHRELSDNLYAAYARGLDARNLVSIVGEDGLSDADRRFLAFSDAFEKEFINQGETIRSMDETLDIGGRLLAALEARKGKAP